MNVGNGLAGTVCLVCRIRVRSFGSKSTLFEFSNVKFTQFTLGPLREGLSDYGGSGIAHQEAHDSNEMVLFLLPSCNLSRAVNAVLSMRTQEEGSNQEAMALSGNPSETSTPHTHTHTHTRKYEQTSAKIWPRFKKGKMKTFRPYVCSYLCLVCGSWGSKTLPELLYSGHLSAMLLCHACDTSKLIKMVSVPVFSTTGRL